ncbi:MAG: hypothetical protein K1X74_08145 [Pirellulales bacterium]|nr:hypothetical protein [Pirellulales bacterium]
MKLRVGVLLVAALIDPAALARAAGDSESPAEDGLVYVRAETREESHRASLAASGYGRWPSGWHFIGPFDLAASGGLATVYPPEQGIDLNGRYAGKSGEARWRKVSINPNIAFDLKRLAPGPDAVGYLYRTIEFDRPLSVRASLGTDDGIALWVNGEQIVQRDRQRGDSPDEVRAVLPLRAGKNEILLKLANREGDWSVYFNVVPPSRLLARLERRLDDDFPLAGEAQHYRMLTLPVPEDRQIEVGGLAFRPDGSLLVGTRRGEIWQIAQPTADDLDAIEFRPLARGLHEILGLAVDGADVLVGQRPEVTRLRDTDGDRLPDEFDCVCDHFGISGDYHEFLYGPVRGADGQLFITLNTSLAGGHRSKVAYRGWCLRVSPDDGRVTPWASGLRSPNGLAFDPAGRLFCTDNQGEWVPACKLQEMREGDFCGHVDSLRWRADRIGQPEDDPATRPEFVPPALWFPFFVCRSASEPVWDTTGGRFGPFTGQCFVGDVTNALLMRVYLEEVGGRQQGACFVFRRGFQCGVNRLAFAPDGSLLVGETNRGWGSIGGQEQGVQRLVYTGHAPFEIAEMRATSVGWDLKFTQPLRAETADEAKAYSIDSFTYHYWDTYGSPEIDRRKHAIEQVQIDADGQTVHLQVAGREARRVYFLRISGVNSTAGEQLMHREAWYTLNAIPEAQVP